MNICLVSQEYPYETDFGGIATYMGYLSKGLTNLGNKVFVICRSFKEDSINKTNNLVVYRLKENDEYEYRVRVAETIKTISKSVKIDIIESPEWGADLIEYYHIYKEKLGIPVVIKLHTPYFVWKKYNYLQEREMNKKIEYWEKKIICEADSVFSCSDDLKIIVSAKYGLDSKMIRTIPNMISVPARKLIEKDKVVSNAIYYIGSIEQRKGVLILAQAFNTIKKKIPSAKLFFVGRDTNRNDKNISTVSYIKSIVEDETSVEFVEHVKNDFVVSYMELANVLVFPSLYENFPYVVLESMLCGKAIVGSRSGGMKEMLKENREALFYTPEDAIELAGQIIKILTNEELCEELGKAARKRITQFEMDKVVHEQLKYYKEVVRIKNER